MRLFVIALGLWGGAQVGYSQVQDAEKSGGTLKATVVDGQASAAGVTVCSQGSHTRKVELMTTGEKKLPCSVHYKKETEQPGHDQIIYTAQNDLAYCESKARAFVEKLNGQGWKCSP